MKLLLLIHTSIASIALCSIALSAERIPGTQVTIEPPAGYELSKDFLGYRNDDTDSNITVVELAGPYEECIAGLSDENLTGQGLKVISREEVKLKDIPGLVIKAERELEDGTYIQLMLAFGNEKTVMFNSITPKAAFAEIEKPLRKSFLEAVWQPELKVGLLEGLPFTIKDSGDLKLSGKVGQAVTFTLNGKTPQPDIKKPLVLANSVGSPEFNETLDPKVYAVALLDQMNDIPKDRNIIEAKEIEIDGMKGFQVGAIGKQPGAEDEIYYRVSVALSTGRIHVIQCRVASESQEKYTPDFDRILESYKVIE